MIRALLCALLFWALPAVASLTDLWWVKTEPGWGLSLIHQNNKIFGVWYVYDAAGKAVWLAMPDGTFSNAGRTYAGALYSTTGPAYSRPSFDSLGVKATPVGTARIDFAADFASATVTYNVGATRVVRRVTRQPFGNTPANAPDDHSDLWFDPDEPGWGLAIAQHGEIANAVWYTYGEDGRPMWIVMPDGRYTQPGRFAGKLYTTEGGSFYGATFNPASVTVREVGAGTITIIGAEGRFTGTVNGYAINKRLTRQLFGAPKPPNARPTSITLTAAPLVSPPVAPAVAKLTAAVSDADGIARVEFFRGSEKVSQDVARPYEVSVNGLPAGRNYFSAKATDARGNTRMSTVWLDVKPAPGTAPPSNKVPTVALTAPQGRTTILAGATVDLAATAADYDGSVVRVDYYAGAVVVAQAAAAPWSASFVPLPGDYDLVAVATDDKGATGSSAPVSLSVVGPAAAVDAATRDAARFLTQATFGPKGVAEIHALRARGYPSWLNEQFAKPAASHVAYVNARLRAGEKPYEERAYEAIWQQWLFEPGQLRARMSFALSEIFVISNIAPDLDTYAMASYMDMLNRNAFGNYRQLLEDVTLHPAMGYYLNMIGSKKADPERGTHPNENYAREVMQLFSIGLYKLNPDGTRVLDGTGKPIPTYDQAVVAAMAAAFTGWSFAGNDTLDAELFDPAKEDWQKPLIPWEMHHDTQAKVLFDGIQLPAGQAARQDMKLALDAIFHHPNVGPFVGRQLIQRFVTSNPSPAYIGRVAATFADNGAGVRGDLRAVLQAVLLDPEARDLAKTAEAGWGKQREPVIRFANFLRGFNATSPSGRNRIWYLDSADEGLNQSPLLAPSVFNFFSPNYRQPGPLAAANLVAPEFQITTETSMVGGLNFFARLLRKGYYGYDDTRLTLNLAELNALAPWPAALVDRLNVLFFAGGMSAGLRTTLVASLASLPQPKTGGGDGIDDRVKAALVLVAMSPEYVIQR
jgi:uncharacterized protein (DUF1800 family)